MASSDERTLAAKKAYAAHAAEYGHRASDTNTRENNARYIHKFAEYLRTHWDSSNNSLAEHLLPELLDVLDVGVGGGIDLVLLAREKGIRSWGVELSPEMAAVALETVRRELTESVLPSPVVAVADVLAQGWETDPIDRFPQKFHGVLAQSFIHLFPASQLPSVLARLRELLHPGGLLHFSTTVHENSSEGMESKEDYVNGGTDTVQRFRRRFTRQEIYDVASLLGGTVLERYDILAPDGKLWVNSIVAVNTTLVAHGNAAVDTVLDADSSVSRLSLRSFDDACVAADDALLQSRKQRRVKLCVGGRMFETYSDTLTAFPETLLGAMFLERNSDFRNASMPRDEQDDEEAIFFDRNSDVFQVILDYYRTRTLHIPDPLPFARSLLVSELEFFQLPYELVLQVCPPGEMAAARAKSRVWKQKKWSFQAIEQIEAIFSAAAEAGVRSVRVDILRSNSYKRIADSVVEHVTSPVKGSHMHKNLLAPELQEALMDGGFCDLFVQRFRERGYKVSMATWSQGHNFDLCCVFW